MSCRWSAQSGVVAAALLVVALSGCGGDGGSGASSSTGVTNGVADAGQPVDGGELVVGVAEETRGWNPTQVLWTNGSYPIALAIFDPLAAYDGDGVVHPYLAKSFEPSGDDREWTVTLRNDVVFHDGTPLDATAVKANLDFARESLIQSQTLHPVDEVVVVDPLTVRVVMDAPWATFPHVLVGAVGMMASPAMLADPAGSEHPVGTGPFKFEEWAKDDHLTASKNMDYWQPGLPHLDEVTFRVMTDSTTQEQALLTGEIGLRMTTDPGQIQRAAGMADDGDLQIATTQGADDVELVLVLNTAAPPFDDPLAREAMDLAIDRSTLSEIMFEGVFPPASSPFEPSNPNYVDLNDARPFDPERARELASRYEEEHGEPLAFEMMVAPSPERASLAQYLQQVLGESGIEMTVRTVDVAGAAVNLTQGNFEVFIYEVAGNPTLNTEFANIEGEPAPIGEFTLNFTRLDDQQLLDAIAESRASPTDEGRVRATRQAQQQLAELRAFLFLVHKQTAIVFSNDVHGVDRYPFPDDHEGRFGPVRIFVGYAWVDGA